MTREEEIQEAAIEARRAVATSVSGDNYSSIDDLPFIERKLSYDELIENAFIRGAEWADKHPAKKQAVTIDAWVERNWTGLYLCESMPKPPKSYNDDYDLGSHIRIGNCKDIFKDVKDIKDGGKTKKVKVTIELEEE